MTNSSVTGKRKPLAYETEDVGLLREGVIGRKAVGVLVVVRGADLTERGVHEVGVVDIVACPLLSVAGLQDQVAERIELLVRVVCEVLASDVAVRERRDRMHRSRRV